MASSGEDFFLEDELPAASRWDFSRTDVNDVVVVSACVVEDFGLSDEDFSRADVDEVVVVSACVVEDLDNSDEQLSFFDFFVPQVFVEDVLLRRPERGLLKSFILVGCICSNLALSFDRCQTQSHEL